MNQNVLSFKSFNDCPKIVRKILRRFGYSETTNLNSIIFVRRENDRDGILRNKLKAQQEYVEKYDKDSDAYVLLLAGEKAA